MSSSYTYEEIKEEFKTRGLELISTEYNSLLQKLQFVCCKHKDKGIQEIDYHHFKYRNQGCKYCGREKTINARTIPEDTVKEKAEALGWEYIGRTTSGTAGDKTIVHVICPNHREMGTQDVFWSSINSGRHCKYCAKNVALTTEEYIKRVSSKLPHIEILSPYVSQKTKVTARCKVHNITWDVLPYDLLRENACGCVECVRLLERQNHLKTRAERIKELRKNNPNIELLSDNVEIGKITKFKCKKCGNVWESISPEIYFCGRSICPKCANENKALLQTKTDEEFREELKEHLPHIIPKSTYVNSTTPMVFYCTKHDYTYTSMPQNILTNKNGCPKCRPRYSENLISKYLDGKNIRYIREYKFDDCVDKKKLPFDYFLPEYNTIIEYDGEDHYIPVNRNGRGETASLKKLEYTQRHDSIKTNYCLEHNISLIRIPYWEKDNMNKLLDEKLMILIDTQIA